VSAVDDVAAMVLAAGLGTRLRPLTERVPKPAVPVAGTPLLQLALARLRACGARRAVVNVHHLAAEMERAARDAGAAAGIAVEISREPVIAGTGGALREARGLLGRAGAFVIWNGDVLFDVDLAAVVAAHRRSGALATMVLAPMPPGATYATVDVDRDMAVRRIAGRGPGGEGLVPLHFTGVHVVAPGLLDAVPAEPFGCDVNRHVYPPLLAGGRVRAVVASGYWNDLGTPARYLGANLDVLSGVAPVALPGGDPFQGLRARAPRTWVADDAALEGARLEGPAIVGPGAVLERGSRVGPGAVVGAGCRVAAGAVVERAVLWPGTSVSPGEEVREAVAAGTLRVPAAA
jgi:mannose-1-phosphate guanylyltransferase